MTLVLHYAPDNASLIIRLALEEMGQPYETRLVDRQTAAQQSEAYLRVNPAGRIPALETPNGPIFETLAILLWLSEETQSMAPAPGNAQRGDFLKWMAFTSNTLQSGLRIAFYPEKFGGQDLDTQTALRSSLLTTLPNEIALVEDALAQRGTPYFGGDAPWVLDLYIAIILRWCALYPQSHTGWFSYDAYPALHRMALALEQRPSVQAAQQAEGLGPTPFTSPSYATPPEGSAL
jgi:glutathione S-transferase